MRSRVFQDVWKGAIASPLDISRQIIERLASEDPRSAGYAFEIYSIAVANAVADGKSYREIFSPREARDMLERKKREPARVVQVNRGR